MDETPAGRRPTKLVLAGVAAFVVAVVLGRLLVAGGAAWVLFALALPVVLVVLGRLVGAAGLVLTALFTCAVLATRWFVRDSSAGWVAILLLPVVALTALVVGRVLGQLRRRPHDTTPDEPALDDVAP